jgi:hypothetical protein
VDLLHGKVLRLLCLLCLLRLLRLLRLVLLLLVDLDLRHHLRLLLLLLRSHECELLRGGACHLLLEMGREVCTKRAYAGSLLHGHQLLLRHSRIRLQDSHVALLLLLLVLLHQMVSQGLVAHLMLLHQNRVHLICQG